MHGIVTAPYSALTLEACPYSRVYVPGSVHAVLGAVPVDGATEGVCGHLGPATLQAMLVRSANAVHAKAFDFRLASLGHVSPYVCHCLSEVWRDQLVDAK
jgi:hypothetical protein